MDLQSEEVFILYSGLDLLEKTANELIKNKKAIAAEYYAAISVTTLDKINFSYQSLFDSLRVKLSAKDFDFNNEENQLLAKAAEISCRHILALIVDRNDLILDHGVEVEDSVFTELDHNISLSRRVYLKMKNKNHE